MTKPDSEYEDLPISSTLTQSRTDIPSIGSTDHLDQTAIFKADFDLGREVVGSGVEEAHVAFFCVEEGWRVDI